MKNALAAALVLGTASAVLANENERGWPASASQAEQDWHESQQGLFRNHMGNGGAVYDYIGTPDRTRASRSEKDFREWQHTLSRNNPKQDVHGHVGSYGSYGTYPNLHTEELYIWIQDQLYRESNGE